MCSGAAWKLSEATARVVAELRAAGEPVDPEVPTTIAFLNALIKDTKEASKHAAFAVLPMMENLFAKSIHYDLDFVAEVATRASKRGAKVVATRLVVGLLRVVLHGRLSVSPLTSKLSHSGWIERAAALVEEQTEQTTVGGE